MKKLLTILAATSLTVTSSALLVSCTTELARQDKLQYNLEVLQEALFKITGIDMDVNLGDYLTESEVNELIQSMLDSTLGLQSSYENTNANLKNLGVDEANTYKDIVDFNEKSYSKMSNSIAQKKLFNEYTTALSNNESFDFQNLMDGFALGEIEEGTKVDSFGETNNRNFTVEKNSKITFGSKDGTIWATSVEDGIPSGKEIGIPTIETFTKEYTDGKAHFFVEEKNGGQIGISALTALSLRFQDYFVNQLESDIISNIMVMSHMTSKLFRYRGQDAYINPTNAFTSKLQDFNSSNTDWDTNVKMIWTIKYHKNENNPELAKQITDLNNGLENETLSINDIFKGDHALNVTPITDETSYDSYFGLSGFQGIKFDTFGDDPTSGKTWANDVNKWQNGAHIISNNSFQPGFDVENPNYSEIVVVLPIYFIELMAGNRGEKVEATEGEETPSTNETDVYEIKDANDKEVKKVILGRAGSNTEEDIWNTWNGQRNIKGSKDVRNTLAQDLNRENLLNELMYMACTNSNFVDAAKRDIYSKYLDKETIYYSGIWDMVKKYIDDAEDEDM